MKQASNLIQTEIGEIPEDWQFGKLADYVLVNPVRKLKKNQTAKYIPMANLHPFEKSIRNFEFKKYSGGTKFINGDTLLARITPCLENGKTAYVNILEQEEVGFGSTEFIILTDKKEISDKQFVYYLAISPRLRHIAIQSMVGSSGRQRVQTDKLENTLFAFPPLKEQQQIASILSSLDDKIELNRRMNKTLEEIGKALFKRWFVDFEYPNENGEPYKSNGGEMVDCELGEIPKGWKAKKISELNLEVTDFVANGSFASLKKNTSILDEPDYGLFLRNTDLKADFSSGFKYVDKHSYEFLSKTKLFGGEVIISNVGDVGSVYRCPYFDKPMTLGNNQIVIKAGENNLFFYLLFISQIGQGLINSITSGSVQLKFNKTDFRNLQIVWPDTNTLNLFINISDDVFKSIDEYKKQIVSLTQIRDSLLPRLMSGKIRVN